MAFSFNFNSISAVNYDGYSLDKIIYDGVTVWEALNNSMLQDFEYNYDSTNRIAFLTGWKGTYKQIINNVLSFFHKKGTNFEQLYAAVGPGIKKCCYEVGDDFLHYFTESQNILFERRKDKLFFDLSYCVYLQLIECGVKESNIDYCSYCTCCNEEPIFSSYRREKNLFQGQAAFIGMKKKYE